MSKFSIQIFVRDCPTSCFPLRNVQNSKKLVVYFYISHPFFSTMKVESGRKEQFLFQTSIPFFRGIQMHFFLSLKYFDFESETHKQGVPPAFRTLCVLLCLSYGIFMTYSASAQTPAHFLGLKSTGLGSIPTSLCRFSCPLRRFHL